MLVFADEAFWAGDKASEGALKAMVTEEQLPIEYKGKDVLYVKNHIHLLVYDKGKVNVIPKSVQLAASRTGQEYNERKGRRGAFWGDRYNATALESDSHFLRCMTYIDLNMVRAGVVNHPKDWPHCGYNEIVGYRQRYKIIDRARLIELLNLNTQDELRAVYESSIAAAIELKNLKREASRNIRFIKNILRNRDLFI